MDIFLDSRIFMLWFLHSILYPSELTAEAGKSLDGRSLSIVNAGCGARRKHVPY